MREEIRQRIDQIRRGEVPEGYKKTKVGVVPEEWEETTLSVELSRYVQSEIPQNLRFEENALDLRSGA